MRLENRIEISAPPALVWDVTVDVERWPEWTPTVQSVARLDDAPFTVGSIALIRQPGLPPAQWRVTDLHEGESFTWETRIRGLSMVATHELSPTPTGTSNFLRIDIAGWASLLFWPLLRVSVPAALKKENAGLKAQCEAMAAAD